MKRTFLDILDTGGCAFDFSRRCLSTTDHEAAPASLRSWPGDIVLSSYNRSWMLP